MITCWEMADFLPLLCVVFSCVFVMFPYGGPVRRDCLCSVFLPRSFEGLSLVYDSGISESYTLFFRVSQFLCTMIVCEDNCRRENCTVI